MNSIDARPVLRLVNDECVHEAAPKVLKAMAVSTDFLSADTARPQAGAVEHGPSRCLFPVRVDWLQVWIDSQFRCYDESTGEFIKCPRHLASWVLRTELGDPYMARGHGLPELTDSVASLIGGFR